MTRDDQFIERLETYLDEFEGVTPLPDVVRDAIRAELPRIKQARPLTGLARFTTMNNPLRLGIAAAVLGAAALIGYSVLNNANVGPPSTTTSPTPAPSGSELAEIPLPVELQYSFLGPVRDIGTLTGDQAILKLFASSGFRYETGKYLILPSHASLAGPGRVRLVSTGAFGGCAVGDEGVYPYSLSPGGSVLTISAGTDACATRANAVPGEWQRSACKDNGNMCLGQIDAGTYASGYFEPYPGDSYKPRFGAFTYSVPDGWAAYADWGDGYGLTTRTEYEAYGGTSDFDGPGTRDALTLLGEPKPATPDCQETNITGVGGSIDEISGWISEHPGLVASTPVDGALNGLRTITFDLENSPDWTGTCGEGADAFVSVPIFYRQGSYHWALPMGDRWHVTLVDLGGGHTVAIVLDTDPENLAAFVTAAQPIVDSFEFVTP